MAATDTSSSGGVGIERYHKLGLGRGINVTEPEIWKNKSSFLVRKVNSDCTNIIETDDCGTLQYYKKEVSTTETRQRSLRFSLGNPDPAKQQVKIGMDEYLSQSTSSTKVIEGKKVETRTISFRFDIDDVPLNNTFKKADTEAPVHFLQDESHEFEKSLCIWILKRIKDRRDKNEDTLEKNEDAIKQYQSLKLPEAIEKFSQRKKVEQSEQSPSRQEVEQSEEPPSNPGQGGEQSGSEQPTSGQEVEQNEQPPSSAPEIEQSITEQSCTRKPNDSPISMLSLVLETFRSNLWFLRLIVQDCRDFVRNLELTHYVSAIHLGACQYHFVNAHSKQEKRKAGAEVGDGSSTKAGLSRSSTKQSFQRTEEEQKIGRIDDDDTVSIENEAVLEFHIQPIYKLVRVEFIRVMLQRGIQEYVLSKQSAGPFLISCEVNERPVYWRVNDRYQVIGTESVKVASPFYIISAEDPTHPSEFLFAYWKDKKRRTHVYDDFAYTLPTAPPLPRYLSTESNVFGYCSGPLTLKTTVELPQARFSLHSRVQHSFAFMMCQSTPVSLGDWIQGEQYYINCSHSSFKFNGYIAMEKEKAKPVEPPQLLKEERESPTGDVTDEPEQADEETDASYRTITRPTMRDPSKSKDLGMLFRLHPPDWASVAGHLKRARSSSRK